MRALLVSTNTERSPYPVAPFGLCLVAHRASLRHEVRVYDAMFRGADGLLDEIDAFDPDVVGLGIRNVDDVSMFSPKFYIDEIAEKFARPFRERSRAALVLGGSGFSVFPRELLEMFGAEYGVVGDGEEPFLALLDTLEGGGDPAGIPGLAVSRAGRVVVNPPVSRRSSLTPPDFRLEERLDFSPYRARGSYPIQAKRGCAHLCAYCTYPRIEGHHYRMRAPADVAGEILRAHERLGGPMFEIVDSTFNDPAGHAEEICDHLVRSQVRPRLRTMGVNPGNLDEALVEKMLAAGFAQIDCTPDSASPRVLASLGKNFDRAALERGARAIAAFGMPTMWFFLLGGPGETRETLAETFDFIDRFVGPEDMAHLTLGIRIYPGTPLAARAEAEGAISAGGSLLRPVFYVSPALGAQRLQEIVAASILTRTNCVPSHESTPSAAIIDAALAMRAAEGLDEPMFRSLLRLRNSGKR